MTRYRKDMCEFSRTAAIVPCAFPWNSIFPAMRSSCARRRPDHSGACREQEGNLCRLAAPTAPIEEDFPDFDLPEPPPRPVDL